MKSCTLIINNLNDGRFLPGLVESIRAQDCDDFDLLGIDAGSTDDSLAIYERLGVPIMDCTGLNQAASVNKAVESIKTPFFAWINADDRYEPNFVRTHLELFCGGVGVVHSDLWIQNEHGMRRVHKPRGIHASVEDGQNYIFHPTTMISRAAWGHVGRFDETFRWAFDFEFWIRCNANGWRFGKIEAVTATWTSRPDSSTGTRGPEIRADIRRIQDIYSLPTDRKYTP